MPQEVPIKVVDPPTLKQRLDDDPRLAITSDTPGGGFWILWGDPALEDPQYGILGFGDLELKSDGTLVVIAMSNLRMQILLDLLQEIAAECLGPVPKITKKPLRPIKKKRKRKGRRRKRNWRR